MVPDLRESLSILDNKKEVLHVDQKIDINDVGKVLMKAYHDPKQPVIVMNNVGDSKMPVVANLFTSREKAAIYFGTTEDKLFDKLNHGLANPIKPKVIENPECQEEVITTNIDLEKLPIPKYSPDDGGRYITPGITISKDPETGAYDMGHYRYELLGGNKLSFLAQSFHRFGINIQKAKAKGLKCEAAIILGYEPALGFAAQAKSSNPDDYEVAGGLYGEPLQLAKAKTIDLLVPARAEMVLELEIDYNTLVNEGPLGEYTGYYTPASQKPVAIVKAITQRKNPMMQALLTGKPSPITENHVLKQIPFEAVMLGDLKSKFPTVTDLTIPPFGGVQAAVIFSMKPQFAGQAKEAILHVLGSFVAPKYAIAVDPDINVHDMDDVMWALSFRVKADRDIFTIPDTQRVPLDPSSHEGRSEAQTDTKTAVGVDATIPVGIKYPEVADVPGWKDFDVPGLDVGEGK
ncbi:UbiD family decarboxylase [Candidatus Mancarchaeum acidiphilum]|uniref:UbiD family decarboxylase n=1 Tax=Candidatus Mancarchaeum acidiphilum TaxID=1920749 RepID=A0A218NND5_9ARCH|nr:UbiD family decarboxylase [Candidatus Mancarchaeum acidiphilum]ASI13985.1 UbiD family decarboxylase [Candidatus Mancarchaeum acidiphilum]